MKITIVTLLCALAMAGCSSSGGSNPPHRATCTPPAGGRCPGPEPVGIALRHGLQLSSDGRTIHGSFLCGGKLETSETARQITLTYVASRVGPGAMACAMVPLSVRLDTPIGTRTAVDGVSGQPLRLVRG
jgi:hypothetical protein